MADPILVEACVNLSAGHDPRQVVERAMESAVARNQAAIERRLHEADLCVTGKCLHKALCAVTGQVPDA